jgi:23S rRNA (uracil1939-C5)-methyltransferase
MADLRVGDVAEAAIERVVPGGDGLARLSGVVTLVSGGLPGDRVRLRVTEASRRLVRGTLEEVLVPGQARRPDDALCPRARDASCGGCDWNAARLETHRDLKTALVLDALRRLAGLREEDLPEPGWHGSPDNYRLRNRLHLDREARLGFFGPHSNAVSNLETCDIVSKALLARLPALRAHLASFGPLEGELLTLESRDGATVLGELRLDEARPGTGQGLQISSRAKEVGRGPFDGLRVVDAGGHELAADGPHSLSIRAGGVDFDVSVDSFFQGNLFLLDSFIDEMRTALRAVPREEEGRSRRLRALDLYAGVGFLTRPLLEFAAEAGDMEVTAVEIEPSSSLSLSKNLSLWSSSGFPVGRAVQSSAEAFLASQKGFLDFLVADPPRAGLSPRVRKEILRLLPGRLLMISCDPPTFARDLAALKAHYAIERLTLLDLFPRTHHVETIALLVRRKVG